MLSQTEVLVLDEADRILDMGFMPDIKRILSRMNEVRQTLFSRQRSTAKSKPLRRMIRSPSEVQVTQPIALLRRLKRMVFAVDKKRKSRY